MENVKLKSIITAIKISLEGFNSKFKMTEEKKMNKFKHRSRRFFNLKSRKKINEKSEQTHKEMWDTAKCTNICIMRVHEGKKRTENIQRNNEWKLQGKYSICTFKKINESQREQIQSDSQSDTSY